ncbi:MAG: InlB B-repeat-containing protein, partial [Defluviitaleaceae bacterium]|nr:InlB B-repeat-containing protein [Defluviitaleaceae bacterium]
DYQIGPFPNNTQIPAALVPVPTRVGFTFEHWTMEDDLTDAPVIPSALTPAADDDVYFRAVWEPEIPPTPFDVTFVLNGGNITGNTANVVVGPFDAGDFILAAQVPAPVRTDFTFLGWAIAGTTTPLVDPTANSLDGAITFVAQWEPDDIAGHFFATFVLNGGVYPGYDLQVIRGPFANGTQIPGIEVPSPTRLGYTYHWIITGTADDAVVDPSDLSTAPDANISFTAIWTAVDTPGHFIATFVLAGGNVGGNLGPITVGGIPNDTQIPVASVPVPVRLNYTFEHWVITSTNTPVTPSALNPAPNANISFTAVWEPDGNVVTQHTVTFVFTGGTSATHLPAAGPFMVDINENSPITAANVPTVTRGADIFEGWQQVGGAPGVLLTNAQVANINVSAPMTFNAVWLTLTDDTFEATFDLNGGDVSGNTANVVVGPFPVGTQIPTQDVPAPDRANFTFVGWRLNGVLVDPSALSPAPTADVTFVAAWVMDDIPGYYSATFDLYFGTCPTFGIGPVVQGPFAHGTQVPPQYVPAPVRANFTFEHWVITGTSTQVDPTDLTPAPTGNVSFTAVWEPVVLPGHFIATFNLAGGTFNNSQGPIIVPGLVNDQQIPAGSVPNPIRTNYTFQHWVVTSTNTPVTPSALNPAPNADISFTAVWEPDGIVVTQHAVTFVFNNGTSTTHSPAGGPFTVDINDGAQITLPNIPVVTRSGQHFLGWQQQGAAPNVMSRNQVANIAVSAPMTFEAVWSSIGDEVFEATFILAGGTYAGSTANVVVGPFLSGTQIPASEVPDPLRTGFTFEHWVITGTTTPVDPSSLTPAPTADISFTAVWDFVTPPGYYRVTFRPGALAGATLTAGNIGDMLSGDVVFNIPVGSAIVAANIPTVNLPTAQNFWLYEWALTTGNLQPLTLSEVAGRIPDGDVVFTAEYFVEITIGNNDPIRVPMGDINDTTVGDILDGIDTTNPDDPDDEFKGWIRVDRDGNNITTAERGFYTREELDEMGLDPSEYWNFDPVWRSGTFNATFIFAGGTLASHTGDSVVRGPILIGQLIPSAYVPVLTRTGYTFRRWVVTGTTNEANLSTLRPTADVSFTAEWDNGDTGRYYTLTFNPNGGIMLFGYNTVRTVAYGTVITELPGAEWAGHRFEGWLIGTTTQEQTVPFTMTGDLTLVADWTELPERNYTLTLNPNGGTLPEGIEAVQTHAYGTILPSLPTPTRAGYTFVGWFEGTAANAQSLPIVITRDLTLTARWTGGTTERNYTLTLNPNGGALPSGVEAVQTHAYGTVITSLPTPTRAGHTFTGWLVGTTTQGQAVPFTITGNVTLTAGWVPVTGRNYTLTFNPNGGALPTGVEAVQTHAYGTVITSLPTPTRAGHTFTGWFIGATTQGQAVPFTITGNLTLTAGWTPDVGTPPPGQNATITLVLNGGTVSGGVTTFTHPVGTRVYSHNIPTPTRAGYNFVGWLYNHQWATFPFTLNHNVVLSAVWAPVAPTTLTVTFNPGTGTLPSGIPAERHGPFGFRVDNFPTPIAPTGYTFVGWYLDGIRVTGAIYATRNMTLFAHYQRTTVGQNHTITFVPNGGTMPANTALTQTHAYGTHINTLPIPTRAGHTFVGWMSGNAIQPIPFIVRGNMTLTAAWVTTPQTPSPTPQPTVPPTHLIVAFDPGPGSFPAGEGGIRTGVYGFVVNTMPNPTRPGHVFAGWSIGTTPITLPFTVRQDTTITARWTPVGTLVNPQTSPIQVTFTIFGAVLLVGIAAFGIMKLTGKQLAAMGQYRTSMTRFNREKRITDMFEKREPKDKK